MDRLKAPRIIKKMENRVGARKVYFYEILTTPWAKAERHIRCNDPREALY